MNPTRALRAAAQSYIPLIKFKGHHIPPPPSSSSSSSSSSATSSGSISAPQVHPASPTATLPDSFATYRQKSQQHGPLGGHNKLESVPIKVSGPRIVYGAVGARSGSELGAVEAPRGMVFDRSELPTRFARLRWSVSEIEAVDSAGASLW